MGNANSVPVTRSLGEFVQGLRWDHVPEEVREHIKRCVLDTIGCGLFGSTLEWGQLAIRFGRLLGSGEEAVVWGTDSRVPAHQAALVNGTLVHSFEMDDLHKVAVIHPGAKTVPSALAVAERLAYRENQVISGRQFLTAVIAGYEVGCRVGVASGANQLKRGFHPSATSGTFGAAASVAKLLGLDTEKMVHALGIAGTQASGLMSAQYEAMAKRMNPGRAAQTGVCAGMLAEIGYTGITNVLEAPYGGFFTTFADGVRPEEALQGLGDVYELLGVGFKPYSCCGSNHTSIDVMLELKKNHPDLIPSNVDRIKIDTTTTTKSHVGWDYVPSGVIGAQMNLAYAVAVTLLDGECFTDQYASHRLASPEVLDLIEKIEVTADPSLDRLGREGRHAIRMEVYLSNGEVLTGNKTHARGSMVEPLTPKEVEDKFDKLTERVLDAAEVSKLKDTILNLEKVKDIRELTKHLCKGT